MPVEGAAFLIAMGLAHRTIHSRWGLQLRRSLLQPAVNPLLADLESLQPRVGRTDAELFSPPALGEPSYDEHRPTREVDECVKDVLGTWIKKLRAAIPAEFPLRA